MANTAIYIDSREKPKAIKKIEKYFDDHDVQYVSSKLYVGDYQLVSNGNTVVDRKQNLTEVCGNLTQQHERFRREALKAKELGVKLIILVEHGISVKSLADVETWINPRRYAYCRKYGISTHGDVEKNISEYVAHGGVRPPTSGEQLAKMMRTMSERYGIQWEFCEKKDTGKRILELLGAG